MKGSSKETAKEKTRPLKVSTASSQTRRKVASAIQPVRRHESSETILLVAGEHSGDLLGADVVRYLKRQGFEKFFGTGGEAMRKEGVELVENIEAMTVFGFIEALKNYKRLKALANRLVDLAIQKGAGTAVLIDYPGFNLRIAELLNKAGIKVVFLVSPQLWGWHNSRIKTIQKNVGLMLVLFEFEKKMYDEAGVPCEWVGHPMVRRIPDRLAEEAPVPLKRGKTVALMPGSRVSEINRLLPDMLAGARLLLKGYPGIRFLLPNINPHAEATIQAMLEEYSDLKIEYLKDRSLRVLEACDAVMIASGTATLEAAYFMRPMVILYRISWPNLIVGTLVIRTRFIGMVNLLARRQVALELLQTEVTPENIAREIVRIFEDESYRRSMVHELEYVKHALGTGNPGEKAARAIASFVRSGISAR
ncbi:MAG: lipid-A-disaccharide synthase [Spirochaetia bacterium]|nr:lipid-A-disaccharide synthase [Spirochaetia bacterium]